MAFKKKTVAAPEEEKKDTGATDQVEVQEQADLPTVEEAALLTDKDFRQRLIDYGVAKTEDLTERRLPMNAQEVENLNALIKLYQAVSVVMPE